MTVNAYPVLCGGTFFTLLLEARQTRSGKKEQLYGKRDGLSEPEVLDGLIKVMYPEFKAPSSERTLKTITSDYKLCKNNGSNLPFYDKEIRAFDNRVKGNYQTALKHMCCFVNRFIEAGGSVKRGEWLVKALLDLINRDQSIGDSDAFYVCKNGQAITKAALRTVAEVCLPAFLLGVWHFIVVRRQDNTVGKDTLNEWCPPNKQNRRVYAGTMGEGITRIIIVTVPTIDEVWEDKSAATAGEPFENCEEPQVIDTTSNASQDVPSQTINNNGFLFQQFGTKNKQIIGNIETLVIKND